MPLRTSLSVLSHTTRNPVRASVDLSERAQKDLTEKFGKVFAPALREGDQWFTTDDEINGKLQALRSLRPET